MNAYYLGQGGRCQNLNGRRAAHVRWGQVDVLFRKGVWDNSKSQHSKPHPRPIPMQNPDEVVNAYYFGQGGRCQNLNGRRATHVRWMQVDVLFRKGI